MLFNKVLGENEKCFFYFYLKTEGTFWPAQYFTSLSSCLHSFWEAGCNFYLCFSVGKALFSSGFFQSFLNLCLIFWNLNMIYLCIVFWHLSCLIFSELPGFVFWCLILRKFPVIIASNISSLSLFLLLLVFPLYRCYIFCNCPMILNVLSIFSVFFLLCFSVLDISIDVFSSSFFP